MRPPRALLATAALLTVAAVGLVVAPPASADCSGPTFSSVTEVDGGASLAITGYGWGEECYDTGPPPPGIGRLGEPIEDIEIVIAQGAREFVVARGDADENYELAVTVPLPADLVPGDAGLWARRVGATPEAPAILTMRPFVRSATPASPVATVPAIATFGPSDEAAAGEEAAGEAAAGETAPSTAGDAAAPAVTSSTAIPTEVGRPPLTAIAGVVVLVLAVAVGVIVIARRRRARA